MKNLIKRTYTLPKDRYIPDSITVDVTQEQAEALDKIAKRRILGGYFSSHLIALVEHIS